jgi:hypothetical protein
LKGKAGACFTKEEKLQIEWKRKRKRWGDAIKTWIGFRRRWKTWINLKWVKGRSNKNGRVGKPFPWRTGPKALTGAANELNYARIAEPNIVRGERAGFLRKRWVSKVYWYKPSILKSRLTKLSI